MTPENANNSFPFAHWFSYQPADDSDRPVEPRRFHDPERVPLTPRVRVFRRQRHVQTLSWAEFVRAFVDAPPAHDEPMGEIVDFLRGAQPRFDLYPEAA